MTQPYANMRILVTRASHQAGKLSQALRAAGVEPVEVPVLEIQPPASYDPLDHALRSLFSYDWMILTSANTVRVIVERASVLKIPLRGLGAHIAAIGQATAEAAQHAGLHIKLTPESYVAESMVAALSSRVQGKRVLLARAAIARDIIPDALRSAGANVNVVDAYRNAIPTEAPAQLRMALAGGVDAATFSSSSSVTHLAEVARIAEVGFPLAGVKAISIGPVTSGTLRELRWEPAAEASPHDIQGLVAAVVQVLAEP